MKKTLLTSFGILTLAIGYAQTPSFDWATALSNDYAYTNTITTDPSGNVLTAGSFAYLMDIDPGPAVDTLNSTGQDVYISKQDPAGNLIWGKQLVGNNSGLIADKIITDASGTIYLSGSFAGVVDFDPGPNVYTLQSNGFLDYFLLKLDSAGNFIWARSWGGTPDEIESCIAVNSTGIYVIGQFSSAVDFDPSPALYTITPNASTDAFVEKLDLAGNLLWVNTISGVGNDLAYDCALDNSGNLIIFGSYYYTVDFDFGINNTNTTAYSSASEPFILKIDGDANFIWVRTISPVLYGATPSKCQIDAAGNIYCTGWFGGITLFNGTDTAVSNGDEDVYIVKYNPAGNYIWSKSFGGIDRETIGGFAIDPHANLYITSDFWQPLDFNADPLAVDSLYPIGVSDYYICSYDSSGDYRWTLPFGGVFEETDGNDIVVDDQFNIYAVGELWSNSDVDFDPDTAAYYLSFPNYGVFVHKLNQCNFITNATTQNQATLTAVQNGAHYQWIDCNSGQAIAGETNQSFTATVNGNYAVVITVGSCSDTSACVPVISLNTAHSDLAATMQVFPNPSKAVFTLANAEPNSTIEVFTLTGQLIYTAKTMSSFSTLDFTDKPSGMYLLTVSDSNGVHTFKIVKE